MAYRLHYVIRAQSDNRKIGNNIKSFVGLYFWRITMKVNVVSDFLFTITHPSEIEIMASLKEYFDNMYFAN